MKKMAFVFFLLASSNVIADGGYKCKIMTAQHLNESGRFDNKSIYDAVIDEEFFVDKGTGRMTGAIKNHSPSAQPQVLDYGSKEQSYKAITVYKPNVTIDYLQVREFETSDKKPFFYITSENVVSGICTKF